MSPVILQDQYLKGELKQHVLDEILSFTPIWEYRFSKSNPPPEGENNRRLLRPVYWLGNWQFACLNYYHPPKGIQNRCVQAEIYPPELLKIVKDVEDRVRRHFPAEDVPKAWELNTCLINYYGSVLTDAKKIDAARVGEHKDFEPGPVASLSFGERALFQFVRSAGKKAPSQVTLQQWLGDGALQIFGGDRYKNQLFHRVQRVEKNKNKSLEHVKVENFETRRINLTFRYVPREHIQPFSRLHGQLKEDILPYVRELSKKSRFWQNCLTQSGTNLKN